MEEHNGLCSQLRSTLMSGTLSADAQLTTLAHVLEELFDKAGLGFNERWVTLDQNVCSSALVGDQCEASQRAKDWEWASNLFDKGGGGAGGGCQALTDCESLSLSRPRSRPELRGTCGRAWGLLLDFTR